ncbi:MAG: D-alanine--D-alanine ligase [Candidatus Liptonbacteria bacterium]|nr:D-alanine--D-alanine ligase [Candidatus Liptonbacteria bacterium]
MKKKIKVGILFGGKSAEHEVSLQSAKNVFEAINKDKYDPVLIGIDKSGRWLLRDNSKFLLNSSDLKLIKLNESSEAVALLPESRGRVSSLEDKNSNLSVEVSFPVLHGPFGEDGTIQGLLKLAGMPFVGAGVLGSAVGMDKDVMKRLLREAGIPIAKFISFTEKNVFQYERVVKALGLPFFVKPANMGSSVGVSKVKNVEEFDKALNEAFKYDVKVVLEENMIGREIECAVLGNENPVASLPGEIIPKHEFYSYEAKYLDENGAVLEVPAKLSGDIVKKIQSLAVEVFKILSCEGMGRVDFFLKPNDEVVVNEINTIPGFTKISMYPKLWEASGLSYTELVDKLIQLAIERFNREKKNKTTYE